MALKSVALRLLGCCAVAYAVWRTMGPSGIVWCAPLFGIALARPVLDAITSTTAWLRALAYRDVEGRHYAFKGVSINVTEDDDGHMWLRLSDVRKLLPWLPSDEALRQILGVDAGPMQADRAVRVKAQAFVDYLERAASVDSVRFKIWITRTLVYPSQQRRAR